MENESRVAVTFGRKNNYNFDSEILDTFYRGCISQEIIAEINNDEGTKKSECFCRNTCTGNK